MERRERRHWLSVAMTAAVGLLLLSCNDESSPGDEGDELQVSVTTRGVNPVTAEGTSLYIYATTGSTYTTGRITRIDANNWRSTVSVNKGTTYYLYGFMPSDAITHSSLSLPDDVTTYADGALLTLEGVSVVGSNDLCVLAGVQDVSSENPASVPVDIPMGRFEYLGKDKGKNYAHLLMVHLYSKLNFNVVVDNLYDQLRTIRLKKMELVVEGGNTVTVNVRLTPNYRGQNPVTLEPVASTSTTTTTDHAFFESSDENGDELSANIPLSLSVQTLSSLKDRIALRSTYDIYDKSGVLVRANQTATNKLDEALASIASPGDQLTLTLTVKPTYLYVLSDNDLDNPTMTIDY